MVPAKVISKLRNGTARADELASLLRAVDDLIVLRDEIVAGIEALSKTERPEAGEVKYASEAELGQPELLSLAQACKRVGIVRETAAKLAARGEFPRISWIGSKRVVGRILFEQWLAARLDGTAATTRSASRPGIVAKVKYRDPNSGKTWSGRGKMAVWLREHLERGEALEHFLVN